MRRTPILLPKILPLLCLGLLWPGTGSAQLLGLVDLPGSSYTLVDVDRGSGQISNPRPVTPAVHAIAFVTSGELYGTRQGTPSNFPPGGGLYRVDPGTGSSQLVGTMTQYIDVEGDMACDPTTGLLYGLDAHGRLFTIDTQTAACALVGTINLGGNTDMSAMAFSPTGQLYVVEQFSSTLHRVNKTTAAVQASFPLGSIGGGTGGLAFDAETGVLYYICDQFTNSHLYSINPNTGAATLVGPLDSDHPVPWALSSLPKAPCTPPPPGMVGWWPLDGKDPFRDLVHGNAGTPAGCGAQSAPFVRGSILFCSGTSQINVPDPGSGVLDPGAVGDANADFSLDAWILPSSPPVVTGPPTSTVTLVGKFHFSLAESWSGYVFGYDATAGDLRLFVTQGGNNAICHSDPFPFPPGWHHVAVTVDRDDAAAGVRFYIDGVRADDGMQSCANVPGDLDNSEPFSLGRVTNFGQPFYGNLDEVEMFSRVLLPEEVAAIHAAGPSGKCRSNSLPNTPATSGPGLLLVTILLAGLGVLPLLRERRRRA